MVFFQESAKIGYIFFVKLIFISLKSRLIDIIFLETANLILFFQKRSGCQSF